jgi:HEAT repeat protein
VEDPAVDQAIEKSRRFLAFYVGKGAVPYGDHHPWLEMHDDNGKASAAAVMFDLLGDLEAVRFFSHMAAASYGEERETGHTGNFFNMLWALPGVARAGPEATGAWIRESAWMLDLARTWKGEFDFLGKPAATGGEHQYGGWDCTGAYLLGYALPRRKTRMTLARPSVLSPLSPARARQLIADGRGWVPGTKAGAYPELPVPALLKRLTSWSPVVRERAALALGEKDADAAVPRLVTMAQSRSRYAQLGACAALEQLGERGADGVPALMRLLHARDYWLQVQAAEALAGIGEPARAAIPYLLELAATPAPPGDLRDYRQRYLAFALFDRRSGLITRSLQDVDRDRLAGAVRAVLANEDGRARSAAAAVYDKLSYEDLKPLLPAMYQAVVQQAPSGVMFSDDVRLAGLEVFAKYHLAEGLPLCVQLPEPERWGAERRIVRCMNALRTYGAAAKPHLPALRQLEQDLVGERRNKEPSKAVLAVREAIAEVEAAEASPPLRHLPVSPAQ